MTIRTLHDLFIVALEDVLYAETLLARKLPVMTAAVGSRQLRALFEASRRDARTHVTRLKRIFDCIDEPAIPRRTHRAWGIAEEAASAAELADPHIRDAALSPGCRPPGATRSRATAFSSPGPTKWSTARQPPC